MTNPILSDAASRATAADLAVEGRVLLFKSALTIGNPVLIEAARLDAEAAFAARLDAWSALYVTAKAQPQQG